MLLKQSISMSLHIFSCLLLLAVGFDAAGSDLYATVNRVRAGQGDCAGAGNLRPLEPQSVLERVARDLSQGGKLESSLKAAGYRPVRSIFIYIKGEGAGAQAAGILAKRNYCEQLQNAGMTEVGIYQDARQIWIVLAAPFAPSVGMSERTAGQHVLDLVNRARATGRYCGNQKFNAARPVRWNEALAAASREHAEDMAHNNYFSHSGSDGSAPSERVSRAGYDYRETGENIAAGMMSPEEVVAGWIKSPPHCVNLMHPAHTEMGVAYAVDSTSAMGVYWAQEFGMR